MKRLLVLITIAVATWTGAPGSAYAQSGTLRAELLKDWTDLKPVMMAIADAMPEGKFTYKSTPAQRDYGQQIMHVAIANMAYLRDLGGTAPAPPFNRNATSKAEILGALAASFDYGEALLREQNDQSILQIVQTNQFLGPSSKARVIYFLIGHTWDIYGQMAVYLRLNGVVPPRSDRP
ncbi:MAG TPA: DinB family protein [Vicinamibacterales bacterium]|nr:DinB family protein [Vicinamibacterales bacterium]